MSEPRTIQLIVTEDEFTLLQIALGTEGYMSSDNGKAACKALRDKLDDQNVKQYWGEK